MFFCNTSEPCSLIRVATNLIDAFESGNRDTFTVPSTGVRWHTKALTNPCNVHSLAWSEQRWADWLTVWSTINENLIRATANYSRRIENFVRSLAKWRLYVTYPVLVAESTFVNGDRLFDKNVRLVNAFIWTILLTCWKRIYCNEPPKH